MDVGPDEVGLHINEAVGTELRSARAIINITQQRLSDQSGVPMRTLTRLLAGTRELDVKQLVALAPVLEIDPGEFVDRAVRRARSLALVGGLSEDDARARYDTAASATSEDDPTDDDDEQL